MKSSVYCTLIVQKDRIKTTFKVPIKSHVSVVAAVVGVVVANRDNGSSGGDDGDDEDSTGAKTYWD